MAILRTFSKIVHLPTWFFIIGLPLFWLELLTHQAPAGVTSPISWIIFLIIGFVYLIRKKESLSIKGVYHPLWILASVLGLIILGLVIMASFKPIHLMQEADCMQYHYTLPRQHLILGSFAHIPWAADDLFLLPLDFSLASFWFTTVLPNKIPQLIIFLGLIGVCMRLTSNLATSTRPWAAGLMALTILGMHGFAIQMGTGMLDLAICYLFLAAMDSLQSGNWVMSGIEFTFFFWSKPLMPLEASISLGLLALFYLLARRSQWQMNHSWRLENWPKATGVFLILSVLVAGPFIQKSLEYSGTPFFPWKPGVLGHAQIQNNPRAWASLQQASLDWMQGTKNDYGHGRGMGAFIKHWWLVAVPEKGVNNAFDYPLGLMYLLCIGPFLFFFAKDSFERRFSPLSVLAVIIWGLWWMTAQQSRFLYLPLLLILMVTISRFEKASKVFLICLTLSLGLEALSLWDAHKADMGRWGMSVLRAQDLQLLKLSHDYQQQHSTNVLDWPSHDVAYAQFPVMVRRENLPHTIAF